MSYKFVITIYDLFRLGGEGGLAKCFDLSSSWVRISLHTEFQLCMLPISDTKVCGVVVVVGV